VRDEIKYSEKKFMWDFIVEKCVDLDAIYVLHKFRQEKPAKVMQGIKALYSWIS
jgi:hypothetical protein